jgi:hypothetical protein
MKKLIIITLLAISAQLACAQVPRMLTTRDTLGSGILYSHHKTDSIFNAILVNGHTYLGNNIHNGNEVFNTPVNINSYLNVGQINGTGDINSAAAFVLNNNWSIAFNSSYIVQKFYDPGGNVYGLEFLKDGSGTLEYGLYTGRTPIGGFLVNGFLRTTNTPAISTDVVNLSYYNQSLKYSTYGVDLGNNEQRNLSVNPANNMMSFGTSFWYLGSSQSYTPGPMIVQQKLGIGTYTRYASSGDDIMFAYARAVTFGDEPTVNSTITDLLDIGYDNMAHSPTAALAESTSQIGLNAFIANHFLATALAASTGTFTGTWTTARSDSLGGKAYTLSGTGEQTTSSGATATFTASGPNVVIGTFGSDGSHLVMDSFSVTIDGIAQGTYNFNNTCYYFLRSGDSQHNQLKWYDVPAVIVFNNLGTGSHTVVITKGTNTSASLILDYVGTLNLPAACSPIFVMGSLHSTAYKIASDHAAYSNTYTNATTDTLNYLDRQVVKAWSGYPISFADPNAWIPNTTATYICSDSTNTNDAGNFNQALMTLNSLKPFMLVPPTAGGSGVGTITGLIKGNGTSPYTAALAGTDYAGISSSNVLTGTLNISGKLYMSTSANKNAGAATLVAGTVTVSNNSVTSSSIILVSRKTAGGTIGTFSYTLTSGTSFTITSSSSTDTSTVEYVIIN